MIAPRIAVCLLLYVSSVGMAQPPEGYELVWADEFDLDGPPNAENWRFERGFVRNDELQYYQPDNARCKDGLLVIEGRREAVPNRRYDADSDDWRRSREKSEYTSSCLKTEGLHAWRYGLLEIRARIDAREGLWPAIWTLGHGPWPACGEVDIMEYYDERILANACWAGRNRWDQQWDSTRRPVETFREDWADAFHVWRMDWNNERIVLSVDDIELNRIDLAKVDRTSGSSGNPFRAPHYVLLNLAIGGNRGGDPSGTEFPARFEVDYVRVYQQAEQVD